MQRPARSLQSDPTEKVDLTNPAAVLEAIDAVLRARYGAGYGRPLLESSIADLARAFRGDYPGLLRCDTHYHDLRHALDTGLVMARLIDGHAVANPDTAPRDIDTEHALLGVLLALYHDIGLLRRTGEEHLEGASLTPVLRASHGSPTVPASGTPRTRRATSTTATSGTTRSPNRMRRPIPSSSIACPRPSRGPM